MNFKRVFVAVLMMLLFPVTLLAGSFYSTFDNSQGLHEENGDWTIPFYHLWYYPDTGPANNKACLNLSQSGSGGFITMDQFMNIYHYQEAGILFQAPGGIYDHIIIGVQSKTPRQFGGPYITGYYALLGNDNRLGPDRSPLGLYLAVEKAWMAGVHPTQPNCVDDGINPNCLYNPVPVTLNPNKIYKLSVTAHRIYFNVTQIDAYLWEATSSGDFPLIAHTIYTDYNGDYDGNVLLGNESYFAVATDSVIFYFDEYHVSWDFR